MVKNPRRYAVTALDRGLSILQTLASNERPLMLHEAAQRTRIPKTTAFRLLATLEGRGFVERTREGAYRLGLRVIQLAAAVGSTVDLRFAAQSILRRLHALSDDTVNLAKWHDRQVLYLDVLPSPRPLRFVELPGSVAPLHATALGKAIAAHLPQPEVAARLREAGMSRFTSNTIVGLPRFLRELERVRDLGFASDREEKDHGAACIAAPVFDAQGIVGAISLAAPTTRMSPHRVSTLVPALLDATASLSRQLGHRPGLAHATRGNSVVRRSTAARVRRR